MKTNLEKMLAGEIYDTRDPQLLELYHKTRRLTLEYNNSESGDRENRERILTELLGKKGDGVWIEAPFFCDFGINIEIGENTR